MTNDTEAGEEAEILAHNLESVAAGLGIETERSRTQKPSVFLTMPLNVISRELGGLAHRSQLFRQGERYVTVDARTGETRAMTADRFCSFAETLAALVKPGGDSVKASPMPRDLARRVMAADVFREHVRELRGVHLVRLPVFRDHEGKRKVELLPAGYDERTRYYTVETLAYDTEIDPEDARAFLVDIHSAYPWSHEVAIGENRDFAAHLCAMLGFYTAPMMPPHEDRPLIVYCANQPGSGKSNLARLALAPVFGAIPTVNAGEAKGDELNKTLDAFVLERQPFILLDDLDDIRNNKLNALVTSSLQTVRNLGHSSTETVECDAHIFATGNRITFTPDLARRSLAIDLFLARDSMARTFERTITKGWIFSDETRRRILEALWSLVRHWDAIGQPINKDSHRGGFEAYSSIVGSIVIAAAFGNPWSPRTSVFGGDERGEAVLELLRNLAATVEKGTATFSMEAIIEKAEELGLADAIARGKDASKTFGHALKPYLAREMTDARGRAFRFGRRETRCRKTYPIELIGDR